MGDGKGTVEFVGFDSQWSGPADAGFASHHQYIDLLAPTPKPALEEIWKVRVYHASPRANIFDLTCSDSCSSDSPLELLEYRYGGLGFRGRREWNGATNLMVLTSEGETNRITANTMKGRWCYVGGKAENVIAGIVIMCNPSNFRAPQPMRVHPEEPFFCYAPSQGGDFKIVPGKPYVSKYRFIALDGPPNPTEIEAFWNDYAHPIELTFLKH